MTNRYEFSAGSKALQDYRGIVAQLDGDDGNEAPIFNEKDNPLPTVEELIGSGWPKSRDVLARGIMAISIRNGAIDLADGAPASRESLGQREYHHLFPDSLLKEDGKLGQAMSFRALNCALITWRTNRNIAAKEPIAYLKERIDQAALGEHEIRNRLMSHHVPFDELNVGKYADITSPSDRADQIQGDYEKFLETRAEMILDQAVRLCHGEA